MNSEKKNDIGANDRKSRVLKIKEPAAMALKGLEQLRAAHRCVLHIPGIVRITAPDSIFFARENRRSSRAQSDRGNHLPVNINLPTI
jgi:hypothetical protein